MPYSAGIQVACPQGTTFALSSRGYKHPHYSVFFRPGSRNSQNTVGSLSQKVMKRGEIVQLSTLWFYTGPLLLFSLSGMAQVVTIGAMSLTARLRCGPLPRLFRWFPTSEIPLETSALCFSFQSILLWSKSAFPFQQLQLHQSKGSLFFPDWAPVNQNKNWEKLLAVFPSSSETPASETGGSFASQHSFLQVPLRLISQFINSTFSARLFDYPVK